MNSKHADPFKVGLPEAIEEYLDYGVAKCCAFNRRGTLLATGCEAGHIVIWDSETRGVAKVLPGHSVPDAQESQQARSATLAAQVTSLAWSRNGRYLLSGSLDKRVMLWDVLRAEQVFEASVPSGVRHVSLSPHRPYKAVVSLLSTPPVIIDIDTKGVTPLASVEFRGSGNKSSKQEVYVNSTADGVALLSKSGKEVLLGQLRGTITVYDTDTTTVLDVVRLPGAGVKVVSMSLNRQGNLLLVNCSDKAVRMYEMRQRRKDAPTYNTEQLKQALSTVEAGTVGSLLHELHDSILQPPPTTNTFQNAVEKQPWRGAVFSGDSEHVVGAVQSKSDHRVYIWSRVYGKLERILEGPRNETCQELIWHPRHPLLVTLSGTGRVYLWAQIYNENWSAFAPDFQELDDNVEYVEQEDEFDINEKPASATEAEQAAAEEQAVDVLTKEKLLVFSSDDEEEDDQGSEEPLYWLPAEVNPVLSAAPDATDNPDGKDDQDEGSGESSDEDDERGQQPEDLILDKPRDRKRRVRFEDSYQEDDDDEDDDPGPSRGAARTSKQGKPGGRRGRPPKHAGPTPPPPAAAPGANLAPYGSYSAPGNPGNRLNPVLQQQPSPYGMGGYMQQQQWPGSR